MRGLAAAGALLALGLGCQGDDWIIAGELPEDSPLAAGDERTPDLVNDPDGCPSATDVPEQRQQAYGMPSVTAEHVGRWQGELTGDAAAGFPSPAVELVVAADGSGTLRFGGAALVALDEDAERGYLCDAGAAGVVCGSASGYVGGFAYPIEGAQSRERVLSFQIVTADPWDAWCARHAPVRTEDPLQLCGFAFGVSRGTLHWSELGCTRDDGDVAEEIDCALMYALEYCACARDGCFASFARSMGTGLALSADGTSLSGLLWYEDEGKQSPLSLRRVP